ncbi:MAG: NPCBM/NEW2 domain-containing protein [Planctomycetes bacterium]|nr:NPCBM/NEW2 domain-containing protein [Planctomycetota bacterium]
MSQARAVNVEVERIDGQRLWGEWRGCPGGRSVQILTEQGEQHLPVSSVVSITFDNASVKPHGDALFYLADGGRIYGKMLDGSILDGKIPDGAQDAVVFAGLLGNAATVPFSHLAGVQLVLEAAPSQARDLFRNALRTRLAGQDVLITRGDDDAKTLRGRLVRLDTHGGSFDFSERTRTFKREKVFGVVLATGARRTPNNPATISLTDGSVVTGRIDTADSKMLRLATSLDLVVEFQLARIARIDLISDRLIYLSDLIPVSQRSDGILHRPWPVRMDRSVSAKVLSMDGRTFDKGIGCHAFTELAYDLGRAYEAFAVTIGIDDAVRPRGSVVFRILGDGEVLFDSGPITGRDEPRDIIVDITGVDRLTLIVDYADDLDLSDHADWGGGRLIKPERGAPGEDSL